MERVIDRHNWRCHAYCLMDNHYHLVIETPDGNLSQGMRQLNGIYTQTFNRRHQRVGHIFQGRFKAFLVDQQNYLLELCRYVVLNPVRAGLVRLPEEFVWSSYNATAARIEQPGFLTCDWVLQQFANSRKQAVVQYRQFVSDGIGQAASWGQLGGKAVLGSEPYVTSITEHFRQSASVSEVPRAQRFATRPELDRLLPADIRNSKPARNRAIYSAHQDHGYTLTAIASQVGLHYTTVSKLVKAGGKN